MPVNVTDADFIAGRGSSANPCAENYGGTSAFSEKESQAVKNGILRLKHRIVAYLNVHSYSQVDHLTIIKNVTSSKSRYFQQNSNIEMCTIMLGPHVTVRIYKNET